jgi:hypothetical protein
LSYVGQVSAASSAHSIAVGYVTSIQGLGDLFSGPAQNESTALLTYYTELQTTSVFENGPMTIIERSGTRPRQCQLTGAGRL